MERKRKDQEVEKLEAELSAFKPLADLEASGLLTGLPKTRLPLLKDFVPTPEDIDNAHMLLISCMVRGGFPVEYGTELIKLVEEQRLNARENVWRKTEEESKRQLALLLRKKATRRMFFSVLAGVVLGVGGFIEYLNDFTPEGQLKKQGREKAGLEEEKRRLLELEKSNVLGLSPSSESSWGWRIRYMPRDENVRMVVESKYTVEITHPGGEYIMYGPSDSMQTNIRLAEHPRLGGGIPKLVVVKGWTPITEDVQEWLLRDQPDDKIDTRAVVFEKTDGSVRFHRAIVRLPTAKPLFEISRVYLVNADQIR